MKETAERTYGLEPIIYEDSVVLILGTLPGKTSLEKGKYYCDSTNKFWDILFGACGESLQKTDEAKEALLKKYKIALWDMAHSAIRVKPSDKNPEETIDTSSDKFIEEEQPNDLPRLLTKYSNIKLIIFNGKESSEYFHKYYKNTAIPYIWVASSSGARSVCFDEKLAEWKVALSSVIPQSQIKHRLEWVPSEEIEKRKRKKAVKA